MRKTRLTSTEHQQIDRELKAMSDRLVEIAIRLQKAFAIRGPVDTAFVSATSALGKARRKLAAGVLDQAAEIQATPITEGE